MNAYGEVAFEAVLHCHKWAADPAKAWEIAAQAAFPHSKSMQTKSCPRGAFLGLCAAGLIRDVPAKTMSIRAGLNADYAIRAVTFLRKDHSLATDPQALWREVMGPLSKAHNGQMDVVLNLWNREMLKGS